MKFLFLITGIWLYAAQTQTPNFIGMSKQDIIKVMGKSNPGFDLDEGAVNKTYKYIKFVDKYNEETWLFFLTDDDKCSRTKLISDFSNQKIRVEELNKKYKKAGENKWEFTENGISYIVELNKEEWFFTIVTKEKK
jgi:hypothetical protein